MPLLSPPPYCAAIIGHQQCDTEKVCMFTQLAHVQARPGEGELPKSPCQTHAVGRKPARLKINSLQKDLQHPDCAGQLKSSSPDLEAVCQTPDLAVPEASSTALFPGCLDNNCAAKGWTGRSYFKLQLRVHMLSKEPDEESHCC